jgi:hypothetical protein
MCAGAFAAREGADGTIGETLCVGRAHDAAGAAPSPWIKRSGANGGRRTLRAYGLFLIEKLGNLRRVKVSRGGSAYASFGHDAAPLDETIV